MADDSINIVQPFDFHPCNSPRGMLYYDLNILTDDQQIQLNSLKRNTIRDDEKYLARHPEVRALVALVTRQVLLHRPRTDLHEFVARYFERPKLDIQTEMENYILEREPHIYEGDSAVVIHEESSEETTSFVEEEEFDIEALPRKMLDEILYKAFHRLGIDTDQPDTLTDVMTTSSGFSVVKDIIAEVIDKAAKEEQDDILKYLLKSKEEQEEEEEITETPKAKSKSLEDENLSSDGLTREDTIIATTKDDVVIEVTERQTLPEATLETKEPSQETPIEVLLEAPVVEEINPEKDPADQQPTTADEQTQIPTEITHQDSYSQSEDPDVTSEVEEAFTEISTITKTGEESYLTEITETTITEDT